MKNFINKKYDITILFVEDEDSIRELIAQSLEQIVQRVICATNGEEGLEIYQNNHIDLIVTDMNMPKLNGIEMLTRIRQTNEDVYSIILSGNDPKDYIEDYAIVDILNDYLQKPVDIFKLFEKVAKSARKIFQKRDYYKNINLLHQYKNALDESAIVSKTDKLGNITYVNDKFCLISGYTQDELLGKRHNIVKDPQTPMSVYEKIWSTLCDKKVYKGEIKNIDKSGNAYYLTSTIVPILDNNGEILEFLGIQYCTTKLHETIQEAQRAEKVKTTFLANMSHEIRTPLNGILGFAELLAKTKLDARQKEFVSIIKNSSQNLLAIINDILDFSKIEANQLEIENAPLNLAQEIAITTKMFHLKAEEKGINFVFECDEKIPPCLVCDPLRIKQVIINLVNNAIKFTDKGGVKLTMKTLFVDEKKATVAFSVQDTGIGILPQKQKTIFDPFSQADASITRQYGGTGLGLSITKQLIELLGGELTLESEYGQGSTFGFILMFDICHETFETARSVDFRFSFHSRVLVAEDNKTNQMLIEHLLASEDIAYTIVPNGLEAVNEYKQNHTKYDMIFMDINMPIMDGVSATEAILAFEKENGITHTPIIALTANAIKGDKERFLAAGMDAYLSKPIDKDELKARISEFSYFTFEHQESLVFDDEPQNTDYDKAKVADAMALPLEFVDELLKAFFESAEEEMRILQIAVEANDMKQIIEASHSIKGAAANLRLIEIEQKAREIEENAKNKVEVNYMILVSQLNVLIIKYKGLV